MEQVSEVTEVSNHFLESCGLFCMYRSLDYIMYYIMYYYDRLHHALHMYYDSILSQYTAQLHGHVELVEPVKYS